MAGYEEQLITVDEVNAQHEIPVPGGDRFTISVFVLQYDEDGPESVHRLNVLAND